MRNQVVTSTRRASLLLGCLAACTIVALAACGSSKDDGPADSFDSGTGGDGSYSYDAAGGDGGSDSGSANTSFCLFDDPASTFDSKCTFAP